MSIPTDKSTEFMKGGGWGHGGGGGHGGHGSGGMHGGWGHGGGRGGGGRWGGRGWGHGGGRGGWGHGGGGGRWGGRGWGNSYYGDYGNYGGTYYPWYSADSYYPYGLYPYSYPVTTEIPQQNIVTQNLGVCTCETDLTDPSKLKISNQCINTSVPVCVSENTCQCQTLN